MTTSVGSVKGTAEYPSVSGGAIPTPTLQFRRVKLKDVQAFIKQNHYSRTHPGGVTHAFAAYRDDTLVGAMLFGYMAGNPKGMCFLHELDSPKFYRELMRLVLVDDTPKNTETRFIGWALRELRKDPELVGLVSFADPDAGHAGTIYAASNWIYTGLQKQDRPHLIVNGTVVHPRMCLDNWGTSSVAKLQALGLTVETKPRLPKHRFVYVWDQRLLPCLKYPPVKWQRKESR